MKKVLLVTMSFLSLNCQPSDSKETSQERQGDKIMSWSSSDSIVDLEVCSNKLTQQHLIDEQHVEESGQVDRLSVISYASALVKPKQEVLKDDADDICNIVAPANTPVVGQLEDSIHFQQDPKKLFSSFECVMLDSKDKQKEEVRGLDRFVDLLQYGKQKSSSSEDCDETFEKKFKRENDFLECLVSDSK